jgi:hypothetical protein
MSDTAVPIKRYHHFEEEMNRKDNVGYQRILAKAFELVPKYQKIIRKKANLGFYDDISDIETLFSDNNLAESLIAEFKKTPEKSIIPAMLSWLYFGKSFERMVERGEEIRNSPDAGYLDKFLITSTIKILVSKSISLGLRTKANWKAHSQLMKIADTDEVMDWAIQDIPDEKKKAGRKTDKHDLPENLLEKIGEFLKNKSSQYDLACLKIALEEMELSKVKEIKAFRDALELQYGDKIKVIPERGIQESYKELTSYLTDGSIVKDQNKNREYINQIITILSN